MLSTSDDIGCKEVKDTQVSCAVRMRVNQSAEYLSNRICMIHDKEKTVLKIEKKCDFTIISSTLHSYDCE